MKNGIVTKITLASALVFAAALAWSPGVTAQGETGSVSDSLPRTITVVGHGSVYAVPDIAQATIGVEAVADTVSAGMSQAAETLAAINDVLAEAGIAPEEVQTSEYSVYAETRDPAARAPAGYHVVSMITVTTHDLEAVGGIIDAAVEAGANRIYGVGFALDDTEAIEASARELAVADARARAEHIAGLLGASVGDVISVSEVIGSSYQPLVSAARGLDKAMSGTTVSAGQLEFTSSIQVVYELVATDATGG